MKDDDKAPQEDIRLDRLRTALAIEAWNREARHRARVDAYDRITGREFTGTKQDPNAAFIIAVMQKQFLLLSGKPGVTVYAVPCFREESPDAAGIFTCVVEKLDWYGTEAIRRLREICDDVTESEEIDDLGRNVKRFTFTVRDVWSEYVRRGHSYEDWLELTYGKKEE